MHSAGALAAYAARPGAAAALIAALIAGLGAAAAWDRALLRGKTAPRVIEIDNSGSLVLESSDGVRCLAAANRRRYVTRLGVVLAFDRPCPRTVVFIAADMLPGNAFRKLRIWALWGRWPDAAADAPPG